MLLPSLDWTGAVGAVACYHITCEQLTPTGWQLLDVVLLESRTDHTSAVLADGRLLLVGGTDSPGTSEILSTDGASSSAGIPLTFEREGHCSIQPDNPALLILTGGKGSGALVTEHIVAMAGGPASRTGWDVMLPSLTNERQHHACGAYSGAAGLLLIVTGGTDHAGERQASTEVYDYTASPLGSWRLAGELPSARSYLAGGTLGGVFYVTGGSSETARGRTEKAVLAWDPAAEAWDPAGELLGPRFRHAVTSLHYSDISTQCSR
jgi:hypothetical protein